MTIRVWTVYCVLLLSLCSALSIQQCSSGQMYVNEETTEHLSCGECMYNIRWFVTGDNDQSEKFVGECFQTKCYVNDNSAFRLAAEMRNEVFSSVLDIIKIQQREPLHVSCRCHEFHIYVGNYMDGIASCNLITGIGYMNVTDMPNGSGFGVDDDLLSPGFGDTEPDSRVKSAE